MDSVLLYSGGLDSELYRFLLKPKKLLFFNYGGKYSDLEEAQIKTISFKEDLYIDRTFNFSAMERADHIVPLRNIYLMMKAFEYASTAIIGVTYYDLHRDKMQDTLYALQLFIRNYYGAIEPPVVWRERLANVIAPYHDQTKGELLKVCLDNGAEKEFFRRLRTCYSATSKKGCGVCKSCTQKAIALAVNGIFDRTLFDSDPRKALEEFEDYRKFALPNIEIEVFDKELAILMNS